MRELRVRGLEAADRLLREAEALALRADSYLGSSDGQESNIFSIHLAGSDLGKALAYANRHPWLDSTFESQLSGSTGTPFMAQCAWQFRALLAMGEAVKESSTTGTPSPTTTH